MSEIIEAKTLYIVGTPIGNLEDITFRAIKILENVDFVASEDTRHTGKLLQHFQINTPQISYHEHNRQQRQPELLKLLAEGKSIALVTDAGMPGISDPGYDLIKACLDATFKVIPIPGVTALITALTASGLTTDRFVFEGFLPFKSSERSDRLEILKSETRTIIFYESPHRLLKTLTDLVAVFGEERKIVLGRELTKIHEEFWRGNLGETLSFYQGEIKPKGEYTLVIEGAKISENLILSDQEIKLELEKLLQQGMSKSQASRYLAKLTNRSRQEIYQLALESKDKFS
jgi:16S rRNA (cytidine1402-2'-O)-methyltransferase